MVISGPFCEVFWGVESAPERRINLVEVRITCRAHRLSDTTAYQTDEGERGAGEEPFPLGGKEPFSYRVFHTNAHFPHLFPRFVRYWSRSMSCMCPRRRNV